MSINMLPLRLGREPKRRTYQLILGGGLLVLGSYAYLLFVNQSARSYLGHWGWVGIVMLPYLVCALIWSRPYRRPHVAGRAGVTTAAVLVFLQPYRVSGVS